jgi:hypothetical protein
MILINTRVEQGCDKHISDRYRDNEIAGIDSGFFINGRVIDGSSGLKGFSCSVTAYYGQDSEVGLSRVEVDRLGNEPHVPFVVG